MKPLLRTPAALNLQYEDVHFASKDGTRLHGWFLPATEAAKATVLFFHGNAENISTHFAAVAWLPAAGYNAFIFDYRGYGASEGEIDIDGIHEDAAAALRYIQQTNHNVPIVVFGQSIGGAIALYTLATHDRAGVQALVVESTFCGYRRIAKEKLAGSLITWPLQWPLSWLVDDRYSPYKVAPQLQSLSKLFIHGDADTIVPINQGQCLFEASNGDKEFWTVSGGHHIEAFGRFRDQYQPKLLSYLGTKLKINP